MRHDAAGTPMTLSDFDVRLQSHADFVSTCNTSAETLDPQSVSSKGFQSSVLTFVWGKWVVIYNGSGLAVELVGGFAAHAAAFGVHFGRFVDLLGR